MIVKYQINNIGLKCLFIILTAYFWFYSFINKKVRGNDRPGDKSIPF